MDRLLRTWRERRGWSLRELGKRSGVSYVTIQKVETGTMNPTVATLSKLARALGITARDLLPDQVKQRGSGLGRGRRRQRPRKKRGQGRGQR